jgi:hypothetical protein
MATSIIGLIKSGALRSGDVILWRSRIQRITHEAELLEDGNIRTADGIVHKSPSGAVKHLNGGKPVDGWLTWKLKRTGKSLASLRI